MKKLTKKQALNLKNDIVRFIRDYYKRNKLKGAVLGISGGKDSAVVAGLISEAIGKENVVGLAMPCHSNPKDLSDAKKVAKKFGFELITIDLTNTYDTFVKQINNSYKHNDNNAINSNINFKPRLRMATSYYMASLLSSKNNGIYIVPGTSNACELFVGYYTKGGDSTFDLGIINSLTVDEVISIGEIIGVPDSIIHKAPSDGLSNMSDEDKMGIKYDDVSMIIKKQKSIIKHPKIQKLHNNNKHKLNIKKYKIDRKKY